MEALLSQANLEATGYDDDFDIDFESDDDLINNNNTSNKSSSHQETSDVLKNAAKIIAKEDKELSDKVFIEVAKDIKASLPSNDNDVSGLDILINASEEVHKKLNIKQEEEEKKVVVIVKEPLIDNSSDEDNYDDEDEIDIDNIDSSLNQSLIFACYHDKVENVKTLLQKPGLYYILYIISIVVMQYL